MTMLISGIMQKYIEKKYILYGILFLKIQQIYPHKIDFIWWFVKFILKMPFEKFFYLSTFHKISLYTKECIEGIPTFLLHRAWTLVMYLSNTYVCIGRYSTNWLGLYVMFACMHWYVLVLYVMRKWKLRIIISMHVGR